MTVSDQQRKQSTFFRGVETVLTNSQPTEQQISSLVLAALSIRSTIEANLGHSKKNSAAEK